MSIAAFKNSQIPAVLALADGSLFSGLAIGAEGQTVGEVVFNTAMTGYQEILSDPSYAEQLVTLTYPHIGNTGVNLPDQESSKVWAKGLIIRDLSQTVSNWRAEKSLTEYLKSYQIVAIAGIDTRRLTRILREKGAQHGCIMTGAHADTSKAIELAKQYPGLVGMDLAKVVSTQKIQSWTQQTLPWESPRKGSRLSLDPAIKLVPDTDPVSRDDIAHHPENFHIVVYDYGVKSQILRLLADRCVRITLVPAQTSAEEVLNLKPDGVVLANGPGDPAVCDYAIAAIQKFFQAKIPVFGICLGFQLLALASGGQTRKMKFGHHGANHPVIDLINNRVMITSQNHGFCVDEETLPACWQISHRSLFDNSLQGFIHRELPVLGFQGHPEASPGPHDIINLFDQFMTMIKQQFS